MNKNINHIDDIFIESVLNKVEKYKSRKRNRSILLSSVFILAFSYYFNTELTKKSDTRFYPSNTTYQLLAMDLENNFSTKLGLNANIP